MKLWTKIKQLFRKSKPTLCWIDHFSGIKAICWVRITEDMAVKAVFPTESLRHLIAGDSFYYDLETKQFSDASQEEARLIKMELEKLDNENGGWDINEVPRD